MVDTAVMNDVQPDVGTPTPSPDPAGDSEAIAQKPEVQAAFKRAFGDQSDSSSASRDTGSEATPKAPAAPRRVATRDDRMQAEEEVEELDGLEGLTEADDGVEPEGDFDNSGTERAGESTEKGGSATEKPKDADAEKAEEGATGNEAPTLSYLLRQAARRADWTDEEIDEFVEKDPAYAQKTFEHELKRANDLSIRYGQLGANLQPQQQTPAPYGPGQIPQAPGFPFQPQPAPQQQPAPFPQQQGQQQEDLLSQLYGPEKLAKFEEAYGYDKNFIREIVQPILQSVHQPVQEMFAQMQKQQSDAMGQEIGQFFRGLPEEFASLYGKGTKVTGEHFDSRFQVATFADQIRAGTLAQGIDVSISECLEQANMLFAADHLAELERKKIKGQVQKRSRQITQRPTSRRKATPVEGEKSDSAAMEAYEDRAAELNISV